MSVSTGMELDETSMIEKKHPKQSPIDGDSSDERAENPAGIIGSEIRSPDEDQDQTGELHLMQAKLAEAETKLAENLDGWQRALAEFQNYKKRVERDRESDEAIMKGNLIRRVLPVLDDLQRALQNRPTKDAWTNGIELIERKLQSVLEAEGVTRIEAEGAVFDPNFHEAISHEPADGVESGRVLGVSQNGYLLGERVIRPALVRVAK